MKKVITILHYVPKLLVIICYIIVACIFISIGKHIVVKQYKKSNENNFKINTNRMYYRNNIR